MNAPVRLPALPHAAATSLAALLGPRFSTNETERERHGKGESYHPGAAPQAVCYAETTEEIAAILRLCAAHRVPVTPFGAGTSLEGHVGASQGGISLDVSRMTKIIAVRPEDLDCTVEAGVTRQQLNAHLRDMGLFFPVDPGAHCTIGGMAATRASGTNAVRYGTMRENVVSLTAVMPDGEIIRTQSRARKSSAGYDLTRLLVGSEGTLGVITEVTIRLYGIPEQVSAAVVQFADVASAVQTVATTIQCGVPVARCEFLDPMVIRAVNNYSKMTFAEKPTLFFEFHGSEAGVAEQAAMVAGIAKDNGGSDYEWVLGQEALNRLWQARHNVHYATIALRAGASVWGTDVCVPISQLTDLIRMTEQDVKGAPFPITMVGHVGDGNFHMGFVIDPADAEEVALAAKFNETLVRRAIALDGTCTGEHGVGSGKRKFMALEHGAAVRTMRTIKDALDPLGIMNPGKVLPDG